MLIIMINFNNTTEWLNFVLIFLFNKLLTKLLKYFTRIRAHGCIFDADIFLLNNRVSSRILLRL